MITFAIDENLIYPNLVLKTGLEENRYALVYVDEDGNVIKIETIKGLIWDVIETAQKIQNLS